MIKGSEARGRQCMEPVLGVECAQMGLILMHTTAASSAAMKKGSHLGCVDQKLGDHA